MTAKSIFIVLILLTLFVFEPVIAEDESTELTLATYAYAKFDRRAALEPLAEHLAGRLNRAVSVRLAESPTALVEALSSGEVDIAVTNTFAWLAATNTGLPVVGSAVFDVPSEQADGYRGALIARISGGPATAADVAQRPGNLKIALVVRGSTSGALVQAVQLAALGLDDWPDGFREVIYAGTHEAAIDAVREGAADVAAAADAVWLGAVAETPERVVELRRIWRSAPIAAGPVACREAPGIPCDAVREVLLSLHIDAPYAFTAIQNAWPETKGAVRFVPVVDAAYVALSGGSGAVVDRGLWLRLLESD